MRRGQARHPRLRGLAFHDQNMDVGTLTATERALARALISDLIEGIDHERVSTRPAVAAWLAVLAAELQPDSEERAGSHPVTWGMTDVGRVPDLADMRERHGR